MTVLASPSTPVPLEVELGERLPRSDEVSGDPELPALVLDLGPIWKPI